MNQEMLKMLESILKNQGGAFGIPNVGDNNAFSNMFGGMSDFMDMDDKARSAQRLGVDPLKDIAPYRVNPSRGYLAQHGGPIQMTEMAGSIPTTYTPPTNNLLPGNGVLSPIRDEMTSSALEGFLMGGLVDVYPRGGKVARQERRAKRRAERTQRRLDRRADKIAANPENYDENGRRLFASGPDREMRTFGQHMGAQAKSFADQQMNFFLGSDVIQSDFDSDNPWAVGVKGLNNEIGKWGRRALNTVIPGYSIGANAVSAGLDAGFGAQNAQQVQPGQMVNAQPEQYAWQQYNGAQDNGYQAVQGSLFDMINNPFVIPPSPIQQRGGAVGFIPSRFRFQDGGFAGEGMRMIPIQTEKVGKQPEMILHIDGSISPVNATKRHSQMDDDEVTDIIPEGSYIASADKSMNISYKEADDIVMGIKSMPYKEMQKGMIPEEITLASLWGNGSKKDMTPAALVDKVMRKYKVVDYSDKLEDELDIFSKVTNKENLENRMPWLQEIAMLNEEMREDKPDNRPIPIFKHGGPLKVPNVIKANDGWWSEWGKDLAMQIAPQLLNRVTSGPQGGQTGQISPEVMAMITGSAPMYQAGVNQNVAAQSAQLNQAIGDFSALGNKLIGDTRLAGAGQQAANAANVGFGLANFAGMETDLEELDLGASRQRINNFRPVSATLASQEAAATPNFDANAIMQQMGAKSGPMLAQMASGNQSARNQAAMNRNQQLDQASMFKIQGLNQLDQTELPFNLNQREKEMQLRQQQRSGMFGTMGSGVQRAADVHSGTLGRIGDIQTQTLGATTQFALQNSQLAGLPLMLGAQNLLNTGTAVGSMQSQNATSNALGGGGGQFWDFLGNMFSGQNSGVESTPFTDVNNLPINEVEEENPYITPLDEESVGQAYGGFGQSSLGGCQDGLCDHGDGICRPC